MCFCISCVFLILVVLLSAATNANKRPRREPSYVRTAEINRILAYKGEPGSSTAGRGRDTDVLLRYNPTYRGVIDRRLSNPSTSAASTSSAPQSRNLRFSARVTIAEQPGGVPISEGIPLPRLIVRLATQRQAEQPTPERDTSQSSSSRYSPSSPNSGTMSRQPMNLSSLLIVSARRHGTSGQVASTGHAPPPPRRSRGGSTRSSSSPRGFDIVYEAGDAH